MVHTQEVECHLLQTDVTAVQVGPNTARRVRRQGCRLHNPGSIADRGKKFLSSESPNRVYLASYSVGIGDFSGGQTAGA